MKIECEYDPDDLIREIGDRSFDICDENYGDGLYKHPDHPNTVRIIDCEDGVKIDLYSEFGPIETMKMAKSMLILLNQDYNFLPSGE